MDVLKGLVVNTILVLQRLFSLLLSLVDFLIMQLNGLLQKPELIYASEVTANE